MKYCRPALKSLFVSRIRSVLTPLIVTLAGLAWTGDCGHAAEKPNVLLLCVDDLRPELKCFGRDYVHSPQIDRLAAEGRAFHRHYVQAPTCGASRYALLTGRYGPSGNGALLARGAALMKNPDAAPPSFPAWFRQHGYTTVSVGKVSHHPGGRGGADWDDDNIKEMPLSWDRHLMPVGPWQHPRGTMHGLANGEIRGRAEDMALYQSTEGPDSIYPDGLTVEEALNQLDLLVSGASEKPFLLAVGILKPHLPFGAPAKYLDLYRDAELPPIPHPTKPAGRTTWHGSGEFMKYQRWGRNPNNDAEFATEVRRHYAACVSYADAQVGRILERLESTAAGRNTIVVLWGDHGWHLGEHAIWGKHALFEESLHSPLIIRAPQVSQPGTPTQAMVETIDVFPTVCDLAGLPLPHFVHGVSLRPVLESPDATGHPAVAYASANTIRTETHRLIEHRDGYIELYDHRTSERETHNIATDHPEVVNALTEELHRRLNNNEASANNATFLPDQSQLPAPVPIDALILFDGNQTNRFRSMAGTGIDWPVQDGTLVSTRGKGRTNHIVSEVQFRDADIHAEFLLPENGPGNSGIYIHGHYELQIINSVSATMLTQQEMGAVYGFAPPLVNAARPPGEWQVMDIRYRAPRRDRAGNIVVPGSITAWLNGQRVQHETRFGEPRSSYHPFRYGTTEWLKTIAEQQRQTSIGPVFLQDHDSPVRFRNVWVRPLDGQVTVNAPPAAD